MNSSSLYSFVPKNRIFKDGKMSTETCGPQVLITQIILVHFVLFVSDNLTSHSEIPTKTPVYFLRLLTLLRYCSIDTSATSCRLGKRDYWLSLCWGKRSLRSKFRKGRRVHGKVFWLIIFHLLSPPKTCLFIARQKQSRCSRFFGIYGRTSSLLWKPKCDAEARHTALGGKRVHHFFSVTTFLCIPRSQTVQQLWRAFFPRELLQPPKRCCFSTALPKWAAAARKAASCRILLKKGCLRCGCCVDHNRSVWLTLTIG